MGKEQTAIRTPNNETSGVKINLEKWKMKGIKLSFCQKKENKSFH